MDRDPRVHSHDFDLASFATDIPALEQELRNLDYQIGTAQDKRHTHLPARAADFGTSLAAKMEKHREIRTMSVRQIKDHRRKYSEELLKTYRPLLAEEKRKINLQFPETGSPRSKEQLMALRTEVFTRRMNIEIEKKLKFEWSLEQVLDDTKLKGQEGDDDEL